MKNKYFYIVNNELNAILKKIKQYSFIKGVIVHRLRFIVLHFLGIALKYKFYVVCLSIH